jgi:hemerythrin superfamily protein
MTTPKRSKKENDAIELLKHDHQEVSKLFKDFEKAGAGEQNGLAGRICQMLGIHAQIEEELFYPAAREALDDEELIDEAAVEHGAVKDLVSRIESEDEMLAANKGVG